MEPTQPTAVSRSWPTVSLVFVAYNRIAELQVSLDKVLRHLNYPSDRLEVVVVDNASEDGTSQMIRAEFPDVTLIRNPENVGASAWNVGMATATGDWRMILDDDCYIEGEALKVAIMRAQQHRADLVSFLIASSVDAGYFNPGTSGPGLLGFIGCAALFSKRAVETLQPIYDPYIFIWANEIETTIRLLDRGFRHLYLPEVTPVHQKPLPTEGFRLDFEIINHKHWAYSAGKLLQPRDATTVLARLLLRVVIEAARVDHRLLRAVPQVIAGFASGLRARRPVRPTVSALYRNSNVNLSSPLTFARTPVQRLRSHEAVAEAREARRRRWDASVARYYPEETSVLDL